MMTPDDRLALDAATPVIRSVVALLLFLCRLERIPQCYELADMFMAQLKRDLRLMEREQEQGEETKS